MRYIRGKDLNLLVVFAALWRERNVTKAAQVTGMTQPALSRALARLRVEFADPLFVRGAKGVTPTDRAIALSETILNVMTSIEEAYRAQHAFDPARAHAVVTIVASDYFEALAATKLIPALARLAPGITLNFRTGVGAIPRDAMEKGEVHLVVSGIYEALPEGFYHQKLFTDYYKSAVRKNHPAKRISADEFSELSHILVTPKGDLSGVVDHALAKLGRKRHVAIGSSNFLSAGWMAAQTDYVLSAPGLLIDHLKMYLPIHDFKTPLHIPKLDIYQVWHARTHQDPMYGWLRKLLKESFAAK